VEIQVRPAFAASGAINGRIFSTIRNPRKILKRLLFMKLLNFSPTLNSEVSISVCAKLFLLENKSVPAPIAYGARPINPLFCTEQAIHTLPI
jgi:hypothetical protein